MRCNKISILFFSSLILVLSPSEAFPIDKLYRSDFPTKEKLLASTIDFDIQLILDSEKYGITQSLIKCAKQNCEHIRAHIQQYNKQCIDMDNAFDYIDGLMTSKFVVLGDYDIDKYKKSFNSCTNHDLIKRLYSPHEQKKPLPPKIEYGITISLIGYFITLIPYPPIAACGYGIMIYGANLIADGYFSEQDKKYEKEYRND